jgi:polar amino acid transport system substrate-binding protein
MIPRTAIAAAAVTAVLIGAIPAHAQQKSLMDQILDRKELRVGVELKYPPIMYRDPSGNPQGFEVEMARAMCKTLNVTCNFVDVEWAALIPALQSGKIDIIIAQMALTPARAMVVDFCKPFEATGDVVIVPPKSPLAEDTSAKDVVAALNKPDIKIAVQLGSVEQQVRASVFASAQAVDSTGPVDAFLQVATGRAEATMADDVSALKYAKEHPGSIKVLLDGRHQPYLRNFPSGGGVLRGNGAFCRWVDNAVQDWINSGAYETAYETTYQKEVGWAPPMSQLQLARGGY